MLDKKIKPHKGGRTSRLPDGRCTAEILERLKTILKSKGISYADWVEGKIKREKI